MAARIKKWKDELNAAQKELKEVEEWLKNVLYLFEHVSERRRLRDKQISLEDRIESLKDAIKKNQTTLDAFKKQLAELEEK